MCNVGTCPKAATQTDARIYLASVTTSPALIIRREEELWVRLVEQGYDYFGRNHDQISQRYEGSTNTDEWTHKVAFWDIHHTLQSGQEIKIEVPARDIENLMTYSREGYCPSLVKKYICQDLIPP